ncbi:MAG TPA: hypothetical protein VJ890_20545 [Vineibacter sp.]|nr:hypothetical protein [Vineibacter sp.]
MRTRVIMIAGLATLLAGVAQTQAPASDLERCESLNALYERYLGKKGEGQPGPNLDAKGAIEQCRRGNTTDGIRTLERVLRANGFKV